MLRKFAILVPLIAVIFPVASALADSTDDTVDCRDLADADCQILRDNAAVMADVDGLHFDMLLELTVDLGGFIDLLQVSGTGGGKLAVDPAVAAAGESEDGAGAFIELLVTAMTGEVSLNLTGETPEEDIDTLFILLIENGVFVLNGGAMETLGGRMIPGLEWIGYDARNAVDELLAEAGVGGSSDDHAGSPEMEAANATAMTLARLPDTEVMGIPTAVLETSVDMSSIVSLMTIEDVLAEAGPGEAQYADLVLAVMQNMDLRDLSVRQHIGLQDHYTHQIDFSLDMTIAGEFMELEGMDIGIVMSVIIGLFAFNEPFEVEIPEDAMLIPLEMLLGLGL